MTNPNRVRFRTSEDHGHFIGFHDIIPWRADNKSLLVHRTPPHFSAMADTTSPVEICLWTPATNDIHVLATSRAWNYQQGSRLQWMPNAPSKAIYNDCVSGAVVAVLIDIESGETRTFNGGIYSLHPSGAYSIAPDFVRLAKLWRAYGYASAAELKQLPPEETGIWRTDLRSGERSLLVSTAQAAAAGRSDAARPKGNDFLAHPSYSPNGTRICFLHRFFSEDGALYTRLLTCDDEGRDLHVVAEEKVSHFDWFDDENLLVWARFAGQGLAKARSSGLLKNPFILPFVQLARKITGRWKRTLLSEAFYKIRVTGGKERYAWPALDNDGHPMFARSHGWIVSDTYPHEGRYPVILYNQTTGSRVDAAVFRYGVSSTDTDAKCDLHPRWDRTETQIAVDTCEAGVRRVQIVQVADIVGAAA